MELSQESCSEVDFCVSNCSTGHRFGPDSLYYNSLKPCNLCFELVLRVETRFCDFDIYNVCMFETCTYSIIH